MATTFRPTHILYFHLRWTFTCTLHTFKLTQTDLHIQMTQIYQTFCCFNHHFCIKFLITLYMCNTHTCIMRYFICVYLPKSTFYCKIIKWSKCTNNQKSHPDCGHLRANINWQLSTDMYTVSSNRIRCAAWDIHQCTLATLGCKLYSFRPLYM